MSEAGAVASGAVDGAEAAGAVGGGSMTEPKEIRRYLRALGAPTEAPERSPVAALL